MVITPIKQENSPADPRGRRYTEQDRRDAFLVFATVAERSWSKAADLSGISIPTLRSWAKMDRWTALLREQDQESGRVFSGLLNSRLLLEADKSISTAAQLRDDAGQPGHVRLEAAKWLAGLAGYAPIHRSAVSWERAEDNLPTRDPKEMAALSDAELDELLRNHQAS